VGIQQRLKEHRKKVQAHLSPEAQRRVSEKIGVLVKSGEVPNTPQGRKQAAAVAYSMEREGRLRSGGRYVHKKAK
jgi:hypothetical protein